MGRKSQRRFCMGFETEYSTSSPQQHDRAERAVYHDRLLNAIRAQHRWLPDFQSEHGLYLDNGSRCYLDAGYHTEFCSPECRTPWELAVCDRVADLILLRAGAAVRVEADPLQIWITKHNINLHRPDRHTWGLHESYTCWISIHSAAKQLIPHLVSRIPYAGAGCLSAHPEGMGFELLQRARHIVLPIGSRTSQGGRAIFSTRSGESVGGNGAGWTRAHLISKDSQRCSFGTYLSFGVTGLLFLIMNEGHEIGRKVQLEDPVAALHTFSHDPWLQAAVPLANGRWASALDIQRAYLNEARPYIEHGGYPDWTGPVLDHWAETLDQLAHDPRRLADRLDPYRKLAILEQQLTLGGLCWESLLPVLKSLQKLWAVASVRVVRAVLDNDPVGLKDRELEQFCQLACVHCPRDAAREQLRFACRLQAFELKYHELGGPFDQLGGGPWGLDIVPPRDVARAMHEPLAATRAVARGTWIKRLAGQPWRCLWQYIVNLATEQWIDLRDPFATTVPHVKTCPGLGRCLHSDQLDQLLSRQE